MAAATHWFTFLGILVKLASAAKHSQCDQEPLHQFDLKAVRCPVSDMVEGFGLP